MTKVEIITRIYEKIGFSKKDATTSSSCKAPVTVSTAKKGDLMANDLDNLAKKYGTDKSSDHHYYTRAYEQYLGTKRMATRSVLEIGIFKGSSMKMWEEYFPEASIYGIDIDPSTTQYQGGRRQVFIGDQADFNFLNLVVQKTGGNFDLVIDDGIHKMNYVIKSFVTLFPAVAPGGLYVIEDMAFESDVGFFAKIIQDSQGRYLSNLDWFINNGYRCDFRFNRDDMDYFEKNIFGVHFYRGLVFIQKK